MQDEHFGVKSSRVAQVGHDLGSQLFNGNRLVQKDRSPNRLHLSSEQSPAIRGHEGFDSSPKNLPFSGT